MDLSKLRTDKAKINEGIWINDVLPGIDVKLISTSSAEFKKFATDQMKPYHALGAEPSTDEAQRLGAKAFSHCAVKDWRGVELDGVKVDFTPDKALEIFLEIEEFLNAVVRASGNLNNFRVEANKTVSGN